MIPRALVVDDSSYVRLAVARALRQGGVDVVALAKDGEEAIEKNLQEEPDVIVMDLQMPRMNGVEAVARIQQTRPVPVLVFATMSAEGAELAVQALAEGAVDVLPKPALGDLAIDLPARVWSIVTSRGAGAETARPQEERARGAPRLVLVASSTGGPPCVEWLLQALPAEYPIPVVVAQHMAAGFTGAFARRLDSVCDLHVFEGFDGAALEPGTACILPGGAVSAVQRAEDNAGRYRLAVRQGSDLPGAKPNASVLFLSAMGATGGAITAAVLTGMGADGADAVPALVASGGSVYAQEPGEAIIPSMPNAAIAAGAHHVLPVRDIARSLAKLHNRQAAGRKNA